MTMEANGSSENTGRPHGSSQCPHEKNVVTDPMTARVVLMFLKDLVDDQVIHARKLDRYPCPMLKCSSSAIGPLELVRHLLVCPELGKGEFECSKCSCWHQFPANEKEWSEWAGWGSTAAGHHRKRSLGLKMKDTLTETLALRRRVSARKSSIGGASIDMAHSQLSTSDTSATSAPTTSSSTSTVSMDSESTSIAVSSSRSVHMSEALPLPSESSDWDGILKQQKVSSRNLSHRGNEATITALDFSPMGNFSSSLENACLTLDSQPNQDYLDIREGELQLTRDISDGLSETAYTQVYPHAIANNTSWITNPEALARPLPSGDPYFAVPVYGMLPQPRDSILGVQVPRTSKAVPLPGLTPYLSTKSPQQPVTTSDVDRGRSLLPSEFPYTAESRGSNILPHTLQELMRPAAIPGDSPQTWFPGKQHHLETSDFIDMNSINHQIMLQQTQQDPTSHHHHFNTEHKLDTVLTESVDMDMDGPQTPNSRCQSQLEDQAYSFFAQAPIIIPRQGALYTREATEKGLFSDAEFETATNTTKPSSSIVSISSSGTPHDIPYTPASISGIPTPQNDICFSTMEDDMDPEDLVCDQCAWKPQGVRENLRGYLRKHKNVHKGIRHHCDIPDCKKSFSRLDNLKTHRREKHGIDDPSQAPKAFAKSPTEFQHLPPAQHSFLPIKRTISMTSDTGERMQDAMKVVPASNNSPAHYPHYHHHHHQYHAHHQQQHLAQVLRSAEAIAQAQSRQIQAEPHARDQAQARAHAIAQAREQQEQHGRAKFANLKLQVPVQPLPLQPPSELLSETPRPDSKRNKDSPGLVGYRGVSSQHAALWPAMQF